MKRQFSTPMNYLLVALHLVAQSNVDSTIRDFEQAFATYDLRRVVAFVDGGDYSKAARRFERLMKERKAPSPLQIGVVTSDIVDDTAIVHMQYRLFDTPYGEVFPMRRHQDRWLFSPQPPGSIRDEGRMLNTLLRGFTDPKILDRIVMRMETEINRRSFNKAQSTARASPAVR